MTARQRLGVPGTLASSENCLAPGTRLADFEILKVLGEGGFGIVYLAFDHSLHRNVAIKEYMPSALVMRDGDQGVSLRAERHQDTFRVGLTSFISEARFLAQFDHPALVKVHRYWEQNRTAYAAMRHYNGNTVKQVVTHTPELIDQAWCLRLLSDILQALDTLYTRQIVHRDIAPDNIIVQPDGSAVLLDFGSARQVIGDMTRGLTVILKPGYAPVEQYAADTSLAQGPYTDIYALAAVIAYAITGRVPASSIGRMIQDPLVPLALQAPAGYSAEFLTAIDKGMAVLAHERPQSIDAFRALLGIAAPARGETTTPAAPVSEPDQITLIPTPATAPIPAARRPLRRRTLAAGALLVLLAGGYGVASLLRDGGEDTIMLAHPQPRSAPATEASAMVAPAINTTPLVAPLSVPATDSVAANDTAASLEPSESVLAPVEALPVKAAKPPVVDTAAVTFSIKPWGTVFVDGRERGVSPPLKRLNLTPGTHRIRLSNPGFADHTVTLEVAKNRANTITHEFSAPK